jgi:hypothetical protein
MSAVPVPVGHTVPLPDSRWRGLHRGASDTFRTTESAKVLKKIRELRAFRGVALIAAAQRLRWRGRQVGSRESSAHGAGASSANQTSLPRRSAIKTGSRAKEPLK